ncbi:unnamed protein product [Staurois parvus]|uniref:NADH dehydrogenase subunit 6 n=1 Tax=Staurois parvus TaxID=386267 RepID=A0ABN9D888_9NEOB|nr:unnamed protein product [Staurois parvus]
MAAYILYFFFILVMAAICGTVAGILTLGGTDLVSLTSPVTPIQ